MTEYAPEDKARIIDEQTALAEKAFRDKRALEEKEEAIAKENAELKHASERFLRNRDMISRNTTIDPDIHRTDYGNALRFLKHYGRSTLYCPFSDSWYIWNGDGYWKRDTTLFIEHMGRDVLQNIYNEASLAGEQTSRERLAAWAILCENPQRISSMLREVRKMPDISCDIEKFDSDSNLFNLKNGTYDLQNHIFSKEHDRLNFITRQVPYNYDPGADCPEFLKFLGRLFRSMPDDTRAGMIQYIQKAAGYSLTGDVSKQIIFLLHGAGANGKSTLIEALRRLYGDYGTTISANTLTTAKTESVRNDIARLKNVRFVATSENAIDTTLDEELIKSLTGGDRIAARFLFQEEFIFSPQLKLWWAFNHPPNIRDMTHSLWRRLKMIPFNEIIPLEEQIPQHELLMKFDKEMPGIFNWAVEGWRLVQAEGILDVPTISNAVQDFKDEQDLLFEFLKYSCEDLREEISAGLVKSEVITSLQVLYEEYKSVAGYDKKDVMSQRKFSKELVARGFEKSHRNTGIIFRGIRLKKFFGKSEPDK